MGKENISATVDPEVFEYLNQEHINISATVNQAVKAWMESNGEEDAIREFRIQQLLDEADDFQGRAKEKREKAEKLRAEKRKENDRREKEQRENLLSAAQEIPADPTHTFIVDNADELDLTPEEFARLIAEEHGKEFDPFDNTTDEFRST